MEKLNTIFNQKERTFSFELFPPKTEAGYQKLLETIKGLCDLGPDFISVTYGAGGGSREKTIDIVEHIQKKHSTIGVAHLTCVCNTKIEIKKVLDDIKRRGICNVLALRGDPPQNNPNWQPKEDNFKYSCNLCDFMRKTYGDYFSIGVAGFPEGHPQAPDKETDACYLMKKIECGADFIITQLFFDNAHYFEYAERLKKLGVSKRIIPGIIPITSYQGMVQFCQTCGASIPKKIHDIFSPIADDKNAVTQAGTEFAIKQCRELLNGGAPGLHFYTLNKISPVDKILKEIR